MSGRYTGTGIWQVLVYGNGIPVLVYGNKLAPRAVCLLTIVRLLGPFTLSKAGVAAVVGVVVDVVEVGREPFDDVVTVVEVVAVGVGDLTDVSVIALLFKLSFAVNFAAVTLFVDVVVILDGVVVVVNLVGVVEVVVVWQANSEQRHW